MVNILLNYYNFDGEWARPHLEKYVVGKRVLIVPLAFRECQVFDYDSWLAIYGKGGEKYDSIVRPFLAYGYSEEQLDWLNCYDGRDCIEQINNATLIFFTGGMPEKAIARMYELGIADAVKSFSGVMMGASAGAMLQLELYHVTPDEDYREYHIQRGLGLVRGIDLEVHYLATDLQRKCGDKALQELGLPVYRMWHEGGLIYNGGEITVMGNVELLTYDV